MNKRVISEVTIARDVSVRVATVVLVSVAGLISVFVDVLKVNISEVVKVSDVVV